MNRINFEMTLFYVGLIVGALIGMFSLYQNVRDTPQTTYEKSLEVVVAHHVEISEEYMDCELKEITIIVDNEEGNDVELYCKGGNE